MYLTFSMRSLSILTFFILLLSLGCSRSDQDPLVTQMQVRNMQTRSYANYQAKAVIKEIINVLQDEGYILKSVDMNVGVLTAEKTVDIEKFSSKFWAYIFSGRRGKWKKQSIIEMTTNVSEMGKLSKVRANFQLKILDNRGHVVEVYPILEDKHYQEFFNKVQKGLISQEATKPLLRKQ